MSHRTNTPPSMSLPYFIFFTDNFWKSVSRNEHLLLPSPSWVSVLTASLLIERNPTPSSFGQPHSMVYQCALFGASTVLNGEIDLLTLSLPHKSSHVEPRNTTKTVISSSEKIKNCPKILIHCEALESALEGSSEICSQDRARENWSLFSLVHTQLTTQKHWGEVTDSRLASSSPGWKTGRDPSGEWERI